MKKEIIKPFNFEKAKSGAKLRTINGCPVEIFKWNSNSPFPIKGIISKRLEDIASEWNIYGIWCGSSNGDLDLVIVEEVEEPKFKVGDWIVRDGRTLLISCIEKVIDGSFYYWFATGTWVSSTKMEEAHLWTIQDAKDGDVLSWDDSKCITIFKNIYDKDSFNSYGFVGSCTGTFESRIAYHDIKGAHPATKEQRELLFTKMKEAGYEWDADALKLKKIKPKLWSDDKSNTFGGFFIDFCSDIEEITIVTNTETNYNVFATKKQAKSALAMARISQIMANDIENFGGVVTDEEWDNNERKFIIYRYKRRVCTSSVAREHHLLAFHKSEQRDMFLEKYPQLVHDFLMIPDEETK